MDWGASRGGLLLEAAMKKVKTVYWEEERHHACACKRRYRTQGDAMDAAMLAGVERERTAYRCPFCGQWHLATKPGRDR